MNYDFKKFFYHCFLTVLLGLTISVCSRIDESDTAIASSSAVVDGSAEGYIRIGNMQMSWGNSSSQNVNFSKPFASVPKITIGTSGCTAANNQEISNRKEDSFTASGCNPTNFDWIAIGTWQ